MTYGDCPAITNEIVKLKDTNASNEDILKNADNSKNEDDPMSKDNPKMKTTSKIGTTSRMKTTLKLKITYKLKTSFSLIFFMCEVSIPKGFPTAVVISALLCFPALYMMHETSLNIRNE